MNTSGGPVHVNGGHVRKSHSHVRPSKEVLVNVAEQVAKLAGGPNYGYVHNWVIDTVRDAWKQPKAVMPSAVLIKAFEAGRALDEAVGSLSRTDRKRIDGVIARDPRLSQEKRLRFATESFEVDELRQMVFLLNYLFSSAAGKVRPLMAGVAKLPKNRGKRLRTVKDPGFQNLVWDLLAVVELAGGELTLDKNRNFHPNGGTLVEALTILRPHLPEGIIPRDLHKRLSTLQGIKARHSKAGDPFGLFKKPRRATRQQLEKDLSST